MRHPGSAKPQLGSSLTNAELGLGAPGISPGYKQTEVGIIPEEWVIKKIDIICGTITTGKLDANAMCPDGPYRFYTCAKDYYQIDKYAFDCEALLISGNGAHVGYIHYYHGKFNAYQRTYVLCGFSEDITFIQYYLSEFFKKRIEVEVKAGGTPYITRPTIVETKIPLPFLPEQRAIATALSDVDGLIESLEKLIGKKRDLKQAAMQQLLTGKKRLPGFNGTWEVKRLGEVASVSKGTQLHNSEMDEGGNFAHLNGGITPSSYTHKSNTYGNTIAISEGGNSCGFVQFMTESYWCGGHCYSVIPNGVDNLFLYHALKGQQTAIMGLRVGSGLPNVQKTGLLDFKIKLPKNVPEQTAIAAILSDMDAEIQGLEMKLSKTRLLKQGMMQELLTGRIRLI